ncbi:hypothetical protein ABPG72_016028 [Tetrahymena utriculariae]
MSDQEEKKECKNQNSDKKQMQLEDYLSDKQAGQYQLCNQQFQNDEVIVHAGVTDQNENIIFVFGKYLPNPGLKKEYNQFKRYFYFFLDELVDQKYYLFYFHTDLSSYSYIQTMYNVMKKLPEKYYNNLKSFYIVNPTFLVKSYNFFSTPSCLKNKIEYLKSLRNVYDLNFFKVSFYKKIQNYVKTYNNQDQKLQKSKSQDDDKKDKLFGLGLDDLELNDQQIPKIIIEFINYFKDVESHIKEPGIFRKAPREDDIKEMESQILNKNYDFIQNHEDPHVVATSLKRLLSHMPEPIIPYKQYEIIKQLSQMKDVQLKKKKVHEIVEQIPVLNFRVLRHIIDLLRTVSRYSDANLMKMEALTKIFAPTLIRSKPNGDKYKEALEELLMNPTVVEVVQIIYQDYEDIFSSRTLDEQTSNQLFNNLLKDMHVQNNELKIENPNIIKKNFNYLVSRDSNLYIGDNTDIQIKNNQVNHQTKNQLNMQREITQNY